MRRFAVAAVFLCSSIAAFASTPIERAKQLAAEGRTDAAAIVLREAIRQQPTVARPHLELALIYLNAGQLAPGKAALFRALALDPSDNDAVTAVTTYTQQIAEIPLEEAYAARDRLEAEDAQRADAPDAAVAPVATVADAAPVVSAAPAVAATPTSVAASTATASVPMSTATDGAAVSTPSGAVPAGDAAADPGKYECYFFSGARLEPRLMLAFTIVDAENFVDATGSQGTYSVNGEFMSFFGSSLDGQRLKKVRETPPTWGYLNENGETRAECELTSP